MISYHVCVLLYFKFSFIKHCAYLIGQLSSDGLGEGRGSFREVGSVFIFLNKDSKNCASVEECGRYSRSGCRQLENNLSVLNYTIILKIIILKANIVLFSKQILSIIHNVFNIVLWLPDMWLLKVDISCRQTKFHIFWQSVCVMQMTNQGYVYRLSMYLLVLLIPELLFTHPCLLAPYLIEINIESLEYLIAAIRIGSLT